MNIESGLEGAVALLARADLPNLEALDPDQTAWARGGIRLFRTRDLAAWRSYRPARGGEFGRIAGDWGIRC